jgi:hypothetical protein
MDLAQSLSAYATGYASSNSQHGGFLSHLTVPSNYVSYTVFNRMTMNDKLERMWKEALLESIILAFSCRD